MPNPLTDEWVAGLVTLDETRFEYTVGLGFFTTANAGPPVHVHFFYEKSFHVEDEFAIAQDGVEYRVSAGDTHSVPPGGEHTFRNVDDGAGTAEVTSTPPGGAWGVIATLFEMTHEGKLNDRNQPAFL